MLPEGTAAPDFTLPGTDGSREFDSYRLADYTDDGAVVLVFYPFDFSPVCTTELCSFRDAEWLTVSENVTVLGISRDSCYAHGRFIEEYDVNFPLLSDVEGHVVDAYGVQYEELERHPGVAKRAVYVVDSNRTVRYAWATDDAYESPDLQAVADAVAALVPCED